MAAERFQGKETAVLRSEDGVEFVMTEEEAINCGMLVDYMINYDSEDRIIPSGGGGDTKCRLVRLFVQGDTLSKVIDYSKMHASGSHDLGDWDAEFIAGFDHQTLFDLILASEYLKNRGLIDLACHAISTQIEGKSPREICTIFNIKSVFPAGLDGKTIAKPSQHSSSSDMDVPPSETPCLSQHLELEEKALKALDIVRCQEFTSYDPKANAYKRTRYFDDFNIAFFDPDKESEFCCGPPIHTIPSPIRDSIEGSCINVVSLKVHESDVGFPVKVFGTVVGRDQVDYRCVYLFRREKDDPQLIASKAVGSSRSGAPPHRMQLSQYQSGTLTLIDPCRGLVPSDNVYFEINLKVVHDGGEVKDFSKGVIEFNKVRLPDDREYMTMGLKSYLSRVELKCAYVVCPLEATIEVNILKGPCNISNVSAWTSAQQLLTLYHDEAAAEVESQGIVECPFVVPLTRCVVAVPLGEKLALYLTGRGVGDASDRTLYLAIGRNDELVYRKMGSALVEVKVIWTVVPRRQRQGMIKQVGDESLLM